MAGNAVVGRAVGKTNDDAELFGGLSAIVEMAVPFGMDIDRHICFVCLQVFIVERLVLLEEFVEAGVGVELIETFDEIVEVNILPAISQFLAVTYEFELALLDVEVDSHVCHPLVGDVLLGSDVLIIGNSWMVLVRCKPSLGVLRVLSSIVSAELFEACRAREDGHQFDSL